MFFPFEFPLQRDPCHPVFALPGSCDLTDAQRAGVFNLAGSVSLNIGADQNLIKVCQADQLCMLWPKVFACAIQAHQQFQLQLIMFSFQTGCVSCGVHFNHHFNHHFPMINDLVQQWQALALQATRRELLLPWSCCRKSQPLLSTDVAYGCWMPCCWVMAVMVGWLVDVGWCR